MAQRLQQAWLRRGPLAMLLWPLSLVFGALAAAHRGLYQRGWLRSAATGIPVVVVGNVVAGGAGKTPVVMALVDHMLALGLKPGVVSRGFGRRSRECLEVTPESVAHETGDEPLLIARRCGVPVFVASRRAEAARALRTAYPQTNVIVCDDGLQHHALQRDVEICVFDERGTGNGWLLPAGPLRERWPRAVDLVLRTAATPRIEGFVLHRRLAGHAVRADGSRLPLGELRDTPCRAVAGIARPETFFALLRAQGITLVQAEARADHEAFSQALPGVETTTVLLCTEKDAVKLWQHHPQAWAVPLALEIEEAFWIAFDRLLQAKLSSGDGPQTS